MVVLYRGIISWCIHNSNLTIASPDIVLTRTIALLYIAFCQDGKRYRYQSTHEDGSGRCESW